MFFVLLIVTYKSKYKNVNVEVEHVEITNSEKCIEGHFSVDLELIRLIDNHEICYKNITDILRIFEWHYAGPADEACTDGIGSTLANHDVS